MSARPVREVMVEMTVCAYAKSRGFLAYKFTSPARPGVPDRLLIAPRGTVTFIEFKAPGRRRTPRQKREHEKLARHGLRVWTIDNAGDGKSLVDMLETADRAGETL